VAASIPYEPSTCPEGPDIDHSDPACNPRTPPKWGVFSKAVLPFYDLFVLPK